MVGAREWTFPYMTRISEMLRVRIVGQYGYARNLGSTPDALRNILSKFKHVRTPVFTVTPRKTAQQTHFVKY